MLQWMGGSRKKVTTSRKSTHKRQKQYFEQRKWQQQNQLQTAGLEGYGDGMDISEENHKEHRSLDVISLQNLSKISQECRSACPSVFPPFTNTHERKELEVDASKMKFNITNGSPIIQSAIPGISLNFQKESASPKKMSLISPDCHTNPPDGVNSKIDQWNATADKALSVLDLLGDDGLIGNREEKIEQEPHVAFSVEGLGKVGNETPVHSPQQPSRACPYGFFSHLTAAAGKMNISKKFNTLLDDLDIEHARMQDIAHPQDDHHLEFSSDYVESLSSPKQKSIAFRDTRHYAGCNSKEKNFFDLQSEDNWDDRCSFECEGFFGERERDIYWKDGQSQIDHIASENLIYRDFNTSEFAFESPRIRIRTADKISEKFDTLGSETPCSKHELSEYDREFFVSNLSRDPTVERKFDRKPIRQAERFAFATEDRENSSLQSEESCSSSAVRYQETDDSLSNTTSRQNKRREQINSFSGLDEYDMNAFARENKDDTKQENTAAGSEKYKSMLDPSRKYQSSSFFQENLETEDNWFVERSAKVDTNPDSSSFNQNSGTKNTCFYTDFWDNGPVIPSSTKQHVVSNGFDDETVAYSPSGRFTSGKIPVRSSSKLSKPELPSDSFYKRAPKVSSSAADSPVESPVLDSPEQESISKDVENKVNFRPPNYKTFEPRPRDKICVINENPALEDKVATDASNSKANNCEGKEAKDQAVLQLIERVNTNILPNLVEQTSPAADITDRSCSKNREKEDHRAADRAPLQFTRGRVENIEETVLQKRISNKLKSDYFDSPSQAIMFQSYVVQFFCVEKRLKY